MTPEDRHAIALELFETGLIYFPRIGTTPRATPRGMTHQEAGIEASTPEEVAENLIDARIAGTYVFLDEEQPVTGMILTLADLKPVPGIPFSTDELIPDHTPESDRTKTLAFLVAAALGALAWAGIIFALVGAFG